MPTFIFYFVGKLNYLEGIPPYPLPQCHHTGYHRVLTQVRKTHSLHIPLILTARIQGTKKKNGSLSHPSIPQNILLQNYIDALKTFSLDEGRLQLTFCIKIGLFSTVQEQVEYEIQKWNNSCHALSRNSL